MNSPFQPKKLNVPGLLGDDAINEQLKQFSGQQNALQNAAPPPSSAVDMVDRIQKEYLDKPSPSLRGATAALPGPLGVLAGAVGDVAASGGQPAGPAPVDAQQRAVDVRSNILSDAAQAIPGPLRDLVLGPVVGELGTGGRIDALGTLTPEQQQAEADQRAKDAAANQAAVTDHAAMRDKLRNLPDDQAAALGMPVAPGGTPPEAKAEGAKNDAGIVAAAAKRNQEAIAATKDPSLQPKQTWWLNAMQSGAKGAAEMGIGGVRFLTELSEMGRDISGLDLVTGGGRSNARAWIDTVDATLTKMLPGDKARSKDFITQLSQGTGSMAGFMLAGFVGAAAGIPAGISTAVLGAATQGDQQFQDAESFKATAVQKYLALIAGAALGTSEAIPIDRMFMRADAMTGGLVRRMLSHTVASSIEEFTQEFGQAVGQDVVAKLLYDEKRKFNLKSYLLQGAVGAISGGLTGAAITALHDTGVSTQPADATPPEVRQSVAESVIANLRTQLDSLPGMSDQEAAAAAEAAPLATPGAATEAAPVAAAPAEALANIAKQEQAAQRVVQGPGGTIPVNAAGQFEAHHSTSTQLDVIDPTKRGTGPLRGQERNRLFGPDAVDRSYFGVGDPNFVRGPDQQYKLNTDPYHGEGLGPLRHTIEVDPKLIYNWYEDPANLKAQLDRSTPASEQVTRYEKLIKDAGFKGIYFSESPIGQTAAMFEATKPTKVIDQRYELPPAEIATPQDFSNPTAQTFSKKGGWAVVTATQEAQGPANAPANIAANEKLAKELTRKGIKFQEVGGTYQGTDQGKSFLVFMPEKQAVALGKKYKQESVLTRKGLEYSDGRLVPAIPDQTVVGDKAKANDFYSTLPNGQAFSVGLDFGASDAQAAPEDVLANIVKPERVKELTQQIPGLKGVLKHLSPDEQAKLKKQNAAEIVRMFTELPDAKEMAAVAFSGRAKRGWYQRSAEALVNIFGLQDAPRFAGLLAALSPQTSVESNAINALTMWTNWTKAGRPTDEKSIRRLLGQSVMGGKGEASVLPAWINNAVTALTEPDALNIKLSGPKVDSFMKNLQGKVNEVTNDAWMANFANVDQSLFRKTGPAPGKGAGYIAMNAVVRKAADVATKMTGEVWTPAEIQETVWSWAKTLYEKASAAGENRTAKEIIAAGDMTAEEISATPDFASLFVGGVYRKILEAGGFNVDAIAASSGQSDGTDASRGSPSSAEGSGLAQDTLDRHLRRAAERLDALRARRAQAEQDTSVTLDQTFFPDNGIARQNELSHLTADDMRALDEGLLAMVSPHFDTAALTPILKEADAKLAGAAGKAIDSFVGHTHDTQSDTGIMDARAVEMMARGDDAKGAAELEKAFAPVREELRKVVGDTILLYRVQFPVERHPTAIRVGFDTDARAALSWTTDPDFATHYAGVRPTKPLFTEAQISAAEAEHAATGKTSIPGTGYRLEGLNHYTGFDGEPKTSVDIYNHAEHVTDTDSVRAFMEQLNEGRAEFNATQAERAKNIVQANVPLDDVMWATDRAGQSEFIVKNIPGSPQYIDQTGKLENDISANVAGRGQLKAEPQRPKTGIATTPGAQQSDVSLAGISQGFTKLLGLTVRQGRLTLKGDAVGQYSRKQDVVRLKTQNDLSTLVHEGGHNIYFSAGQNLKMFIAANDAALMKVADDLYGGDTNVMPKSTHIAEGFAEFFRVYTLNRAYAERHYQPLVDEFDTVLEKDAPQLKAGLALVGQQYAAWLQLPSVQMLRNTIVSGQRDEGVNAALKELQEAGFGTWMHEINRRAVDASVNRYASLSDVVSQMLNTGQENAGKAIDLKRADDPRVLMRLSTNAGARAMVQTTDGVMGYNSTQPSTRGLREALLRYHGKNADQNLYSIDQTRQADFATYIVALRGIDEYRRFSEGKIERPPLSATLGDLQTVVKEMEAKYGTDFSTAAQIAHEYGMGLWQKAFDAGLMTEETYNDGLDRQFYVPLQRDMSDRKASLGASALTGSTSLVKRFRGSDRDIVDPMDVLMHKTFALEQIISRNEVFRTLGNLADRAGKSGAMVERVPSKQMMGRQLSVKEVARQLTKDDTISAADAQDLMDILQASIENDNTIDMFRSEPVQTKGENIIFGWEKGRLAALQLADGDLGADVVNVVNGLGRENLPLFTGLISASTTIFRAGIVSWPDFLAANFIKDQFSAFILTDVGYKPFVTGMKGAFDELRQRNWSKQYNAAMGLMGGMNVANLHQARIDRDITSLKRKGYLAKAFTNNGIRGSLEGLAHIVELAETGTRLGVFGAAFERARKDGLSEWDASVEAAYTATDMMDFGLNGSRMLLFRRTIPFLNAQLQGLYKMMRTLGADEVRQRKGLNFVVRAYFKSMKNIDLSRTEKQAINTGRKAWIKMASLGLISAALHYLFRDDPDYQEAGEYLRTTGWVIPMGDGRLFYIPKPYELAILANFTERALETSEGDQEALHRFMRGLAMTFVPPMSPPIVKTAVDLAANKDFFSDTEIVPSYMQALTPELQFNNYTSTLAKQLGHLLNMSPLKIDHVMSSLGATAYRDLMSMYNTTDPNRGNMDATDAPVLRRFIRDVRRGSSSSQDFWGIASTLNGTLRSAEVTYKAYLDAGNEHAANDFLNSLGEDEKAYAILTTDFKADAKRLNPFYRARQLTTIVSAMRREMVTPLGLADTTTKTSPELKLTAKEKSDLDEALSEYARREMRNTLVAMQAPGWTGKKMVDTKTTINLIGKIEPRVRDELLRRIDKAKVYDFKTITQYWPEVKNRLLRDRENTFLDDILSVAKVMR